MDVVVSPGDGVFCCSSCCLLSFSRWLSRAGDNMSAVFVFYTFDHVGSYCWIIFFIIMYKPYSIIILNTTFLNNCLAM